tara:strand:- start:53 stop:688 length:636 start_codon:yes stop_codon:yes gene_type:complete
MVEDTSPENLRKFLESDDPAMVRKGLSMAKNIDLSENLEGYENIIALLIVDAKDESEWFTLYNKIEHIIGYGNYVDLFWDALNCLPEAFESLGKKEDSYELADNKKLEILSWLVSMHHDSIGYHTQQQAMQNLTSWAADEHSQEILKKIAEVLILYASRGDKDVESIEMLANDGLKDMLIFCEDEVQMLVAQHLRKLGISEEELEELGYEE